MLNYLWGYMILIGIGFGILTGEVEALSNAAIDSTGEAVTMAITMLGIMYVDRIDRDCQTFRPVRPDHQKTGPCPAFSISTHSKRSYCKRVHQR